MPLVSPTQGFYRRHKALSARKRASSSTLCRQEAPPELMRRFFDELNEVKLQQGELPESRGKKKSAGLDIALQETSQSALSIDAITAGGLEPAGMPHAQQGELMGALGVSQSIIPAGFDAEVPTHKKGGRPKMPLFSVRPTRQKSRTAKIMEYIREFALKNSENVDEILWTLLMLRVKGSGNQEVGGELEKLYKSWMMYVTNTPMEPMANQMVMMPSMQNLPVGGDQAISIDMAGNDQMYPIMMSADQNEVTSVWGVCWSKGGGGVIMDGDWGDHRGWDCGDHRKWDCDDRGWNYDDHGRNYDDHGLNYNDHKCNHLAITTMNRFITTPLPTNRGKERNKNIIEGRQGRIQLRSVQRHRGREETEKGARHAYVKLPTRFYAKTECRIRSRTAL